MKKFIVSEAPFDKKFIENGVNIEAETATEAACIYVKTMRRSLVSVGGLMSTRLFVTEIVQCSEITVNWKAEISIVQ